jgi:acyl-CoA synthetase (AMP-forming)/AMP-acid ligase II
MQRDRVGAPEQPTAAITVPGLLRERAARDPDRVAVIVDGGPALTFRAWDAQANAFARALAARGCSPGNRVALLFDNRAWVDYAVACCGTQRAGGVAVPISAQLPSAQVADVVRHCKASGVVHAAHLERPGCDSWVESFPALLDACDDSPFEAPLDPDAVAQIVYTSGTTGAPRGVVATHTDLTFAYVRRLEPRPLAHSTYLLHAFPIGTSAAQVLLVESLYISPTSLVMARFDAERLCELIAAHRVGTVFLVPAMAIALLRSEAHRRHDLSSVLLLGLSSAPLPPAVAAGLVEAFPSATLIDDYATTEAGPAQTRMLHDPRRPGSVGRPADGTGVRVVGANGRPLPPGAVGEVWLRAHGVPPRSYHDDPEATSRVFVGGWARTGDLGYLDADGYLFLVDRSSDLVVSGGFNVSTLQVEACLHEHPAVAEAAVFAVPHPTMGEMVAAAVVPRAPLDTAELRAFLRDRLAGHQIPRWVAVVDELPRSLSGKVLKRKLRERYERQATTDGAEPRTETEQVLARIWAEALRLGRIGVHDDFFGSGGDSLSGARLVATIGQVFEVDLPMDVLFEAPTIAAQAERLAGPAGGARSVPVRRGCGQDVVPAGVMQEFLWRWTHDPAEPRAFPNVTTALRLRGSLQVDALRRGVQELVGRHEALRTGLRDPGPGPVQLIAAASASRADLVDVVDLEGRADREAHAAELARRDKQRPFDLAAPPPVRLRLLRLGHDDHVLVASMSHLVADAWSMGVFLHELAVLYEAFVAGRPSPLAPLPLQYADFVIWERQWLAANLEHWRRRLAGAPRHLELAGERRATSVKVAYHDFALPAATVGELRRFGRGRTVTTFMTLAALHAVLLRGWSGVDDLVLATLVAGRSRKEVEGLIGCFYRPVMLRVDLADDPPFDELVARVRRLTLEAYAHQSYPYADVEPLVPYPAWLRFDAWGEPPVLPGLVTEPFGGDLEVVPYATEGGIDLACPLLFVREEGDRLLAKVTYNRHKFEAGAITTMAERFAAIAEKAPRRPGARVSELAAASRTDRRGATDRPELPS